MLGEPETLLLLVLLLLVPLLLLLLDIRCSNISDQCQPDCNLSTCRSRSCSHIYN
jgi:hypothetical protein